MAKGETARTNNMLDENYRRSQAGYNYLTGAGNFGPPTQNTAYGSSFRHGNNIIGPSNNPAGNTGGFGGGMLGRDIEDARTFSTGMRNEAANAFRNLGQNGPGFSRMAGGGYAIPSGPEAGRMYAGLNRLATGGADTPFAQESVDMWSNFRDTGGIDAGMRNDMRRAATQVIPSFFRNMQEDMDRRRTLQGGYSPGYDAGSANMARDATLRASEASERAEGDIAKMVAQGKQFGTQGLENFFARYGDTYNRGKEFGLSGLMNLENQNAQNQIQLANMDRSNQVAGAQGLAGLYSAAPGALNSAYGNFFDAMRGQDAASLNYINSRYGANPQTDWWGRVTGLMGGVGGLMTGLPVGGGTRTPRPFYTNDYGVSYNNGLG